MTLSNYPPGVTGSEPQIAGWDDEDEFEARARVEAGAAVLDTVAPGWAESIDLAELDIDNCILCVLGQTFGRYEKGAEILGFTPWGDEDGMAAKYGFMAEELEDTESLTAHWIAYIEERRA